MHIKIFKDPDGIAEFLIHLLTEFLRKTAESGFIDVALSGGSTPKAIFKVIATEYAQKVDWRRFRFFWGDERCVGPNHDESNYKMAADFLFNYISIPDENIFRIKGEDIHEVEAKRYEELIAGKLKLLNGIPQFDIILLGLGEDGHTASIFPDNLNLFNGKNLYAVAQNPDNLQKRITMTGKLINNASNIVFLVTGIKKASILRNIIRGNDESLIYPASYVKPASGEIFWLIDHEAASELEELK